MTKQAFRDRAKERSSDKSESLKKGIWGYNPSESSIALMQIFFDTKTCSRSVKSTVTGL